MMDSAKRNIQTRLSPPTVEATAAEVRDKWSSFGTTPEQRLFRYMALQMANHILDQAK